jgi:hypothetical protein
MYLPQSRKRTTVKIAESGATGSGGRAAFHAADDSDGGMSTHGRWRQLQRWHLVNASLHAVYCACCQHRTTNTPRTPVLAYFPSSTSSILSAQSPTPKPRASSLPQQAQTGGTAPQSIPHRPIAQTAALHQDGRLKELRLSRKPLRASLSRSQHSYPTAGPRHPSTAYTDALTPPRADQTTPHRRLGRRQVVLLAALQRRLVHALVHHHHRHRLQDPHH